MIQGHQESSLFLRICKLCNGVLLTIPFAGAWYYCYKDLVIEPMFSWESWLVIALFAILYMAFAKVYDAHEVPYSNIKLLFYGEVLALVFANGIMYLVMVLLGHHWLSAWPLLGAALLDCLLAYSWAHLVYTWYGNHRKLKKTIVIYDESHKLSTVKEQIQEVGRFSIVGVYHWDHFKPESLKGIDAVFLCGLHSHERNYALKECFQKDIEVFVFPRIGDMLMHSLEPMHLFHLPVWRGRRYAPHMEYLFFKRCFDLVSASLVLLILSPVMALVAYLIHRQDGGPVFYKQERLTQDGKTFDVLKFRSMRVDAEKIGGAQLSTGQGDPRVTPVGRWIRQCRIDELPQLINIIRGDMSVVGPRPERPELAQEYQECLPEFSLRLQAKAGLTGLAQVYGKYNTSPYDKLQMDLAYIAKPSLWEDLRIIFATFKILLSKESTEGVCSHEEN